VSATLTAVTVPDPAERWLALGFELTAGMVLLPYVRVIPGAPALAVAIDGITELPDGLALAHPEPIAPVYTNHPNEAIGIDHVVALTPNFDDTAAALDRVGLPLKRIRDAGAFRQGFRRLGTREQFPGVGVAPILELVESHQAPAPAWWGLTLTVPDLTALPQELISPPKPAVQKGRFIATARTPGTPLAFITPES
jgi:hypothetical protein